MTEPASVDASLELTLKDELGGMYEEVANNPTGESHFFHGRDAARLFGLMTAGNGPANGKAAHSALDLLTYC